MPGNLCPHGNLKHCDACLAESRPLLDAITRDIPRAVAPALPGGFDSAAAVPLPRNPALSPVPPGEPGGPYVPATVRNNRDAAQAVRDRIATFRAIDQLLQEADDEFLAPYVKGGFAPANAREGEQERWVPPMQGAKEAINRARVLLEPYLR